MPSPADTARASSGASSGARWFARTTAGVLVALGLIAIIRARRVPDAPVPAAHATLAVLLFDDTDSATSGYRTGLADDITRSIAQSAGTRVVVDGPAVTARYDGNLTPIDSIARALRATHVLSGTIRRATDGVHVFAQLVRVSDRRNIWVDRMRDTVRDSSARASIADGIGKGAVAAIIAPR